MGGTSLRRLVVVVVVVAVEEVEAADGGRVVELAVRLRESSCWTEGGAGGAWWRR